MKRDKFGAKKDENGNRLMNESMFAIKEWNPKKSQMMANRLIKIGSRAGKLGGIGAVNADIMLEAMKNDILYPSLLIGCDMRTKNEYRNFTKLIKSDREKVMKYFESAQEKNWVF